MNKQIAHNDYFQLGNPLTRIKSKIAYKAREKMYKLFIELTKPDKTSKILDIGVTPETSLPEVNFLEKWYPHTENITMASVEDASNLEKEFIGAKFVQTAPGGRFPFADNEFDIVFCSAVLEHVGNSQAQKFFLQECIRVGKKCFLTTPNKNFPIEMHTYLPLVHMFPQAIHQAILRCAGQKFYAETANLNLVTAADIVKMLQTSGTEVTYQVFFNYTFRFKSNIILFIAK